jgi:hypothetical protein
MKYNKLAFFTLFIFSGLLLTRCSEKDDFTSESPTEYQNLEVGKYITYRLDSILYVDFGQKDTLIKYQAKDVVDAATTDAIGRPAWRVVRYLRDSAGLNPWKENITYLVVSTRESLEIVENNLRFVKLKMPIREGFSWKGNSFISTNSGDPNWIFSFYDEWDYTYEKIGEPFTPFGTTSVPNTITVNQADEILGSPGNKNAYSERNFSKEVYAKEIGLVFRDFLHWVFQPATTTYPNGYYQGFGVRMRMIEHN